MWRSSYKGAKGEKHVSVLGKPTPKKQKKKKNRNNSDPDRGDETNLVKVEPHGKKETGGVFLSSTKGKNREKKNLVGNQVMVGIA